MINSFKKYLVEEERTVYFTFGRMNPPTTGHEKLMNELAKKAGKNSYRVYLSQSMDNKKNPLDYDTKISFMKRGFGNHTSEIVQNEGIRTIIHVPYEKK